MQQAQLDDMDEGDFFEEEEEEEEEDDDEEDPSFQTMLKNKKSDKKASKVGHENAAFEFSSFCCYL